MITDKKILSRTDFGYVLKIPYADNIICGFSTRKFNYDFRAGFSQRDHQEVLRNRENLFESLNINLRNSVFLEQVHKARIKKITRSDLGKGAYDYKNSLPATDAAITELKSTALCLLSADCIPLIFWHPQKDIIGIAHAGWRGLKAGIAFKTAQKISLIYKCSPGGIKVFIGPCIRACCYEVNSDFKQYFPNYVHKSKDSFYLDLLKITFSQLSDAGIKGGILLTAHCVQSAISAIFFLSEAKIKRRGC